jgi:RecA-family ATPase
VNAADPWAEQMLAEIDRLAVYKPNGHAPEQNPVDWRAHMKPFGWADKEGREPPPRVYVAQDTIPAGCVTSLYGPGGVGKSLIAQQLGTAVALGRPWLGIETTQGRVLGLFCEDGEDELWRRQVRINEAVGCGMADLDDFLCEGRTGRANELVIPVQGLSVGTDLLHAVARATAELKVSLLVLDNIAQMFGANENDRAAVTSFVNRLGGIAIETGAAILLIGHTPKNDTSGNGYSGSTAWNAAVRSRLLLDRVPSDDGGEPRLLLRRVKSNYAPSGDTEIPLVWSNGVLRPEGPRFMSYADRLDAEMRKGRARQAFKDALRTMTAQGRNVSHAVRATNFAPKAFKAAGMAEGFTAAEMTEAMNDLLNDGTIIANARVGIGADRHPTFGLAFKHGGAP